MTVDIRTALQTHLIGLINAGDIDFENDNFIIPDSDVPYYKADVLRSGADNMAIDTMDGEQYGIFQITLLFPVKKGTLALETKADEIIEHFKGQILTDGTTKVRLLKQPEFTTLEPTAERYIGAVSIEYEAVKI